MRNALLVALREYTDNVRTKGFWIGILILPVMLMIMMSVPEYLEKRATPTRYYVIADFSGELEPVIERQLERSRRKRLLVALQEYAAANVRPEHRAEADPRDVPAAAADPTALLERFAEDRPELMEGLAEPDATAAVLRQMEPLLRDDAPEFEAPRERFRRVELPPGVSIERGLSELEQQLRPYLAGGNEVEADGERHPLFAALIVPQDVASLVERPAEALPDLGPSGGIRYWSTNLADTELRDEMSRAVNEEIRRREYLARGVDASTVREIERTSLPVVSLNPKKAEGREAVSFADVIMQWTPVGFVYLMWISIFSVAQMLLNNTIEEKSNRIIEVLLSSVTSGELMAGKLLGIAGIGLTMLLSWIAAFVAVLTWKAGPEAEWASQLLTVITTSGLLPTFILYFVLGYLLYAGIFLSIGSICNTLKEAQNFMGTVMLIMIVPLITMMFIPKDPHGTLATVLSWIPLYTPFVMMNRAAADPPLFDLVGTLVLMLVSTAAVLWMSGKIFRIGILRTGQPPKLLELVRWLRSD